MSTIGLDLPTHPVTGSRSAENPTLFGNETKNCQSLNHSTRRLDRNSDRNGEAIVCAFCTQPTSEVTGDRVNAEKQLVDEQLSQLVRRQVTRPWGLLRRGQRSPQA
ncbi:MAG: hypothetical protein ACOYEV_13245 [Candidatus Nanopelagicales bacterium]